MIIISNLKTNQLEKKRRVKKNIILPKSCFGSDFAQDVESISVDDQTFSGGSDLDDLRHFLLSVRKSSDDQGAIQLEKTNLRFLLIRQSHFEGLSSLLSHTKREIFKLFGHSSIVVATPLLCKNI